MSDGVSDIAVIGLAVMGKNLALNIRDKGFKVSIFNRSLQKVDDFLAVEENKKDVTGCRSIEELIASLKRPRKIILMVQAGVPVDETLSLLLSLLEPDDIVMDCGNSYFKDTIKRVETAKPFGVHFLGIGVSGGEEGARNGASIMAGGSKSAWSTVKHFFEAASAKVGDDSCCSLLSEDGAGHYVKMVHNGIEYADIQIICEAYDILRKVSDISNEDLAAIFADWNKKELDSYLIDSTSKIFNKKDSDGNFVVDTILDVAGQKGTGKWTILESLDSSVPASVIGESVFSRFVSAMFDERQKASEVYSRASSLPKKDKSEIVETVFQGLYAAKIISYAQGFMLLKKAAQDYKWNLDFGNISMIWRGGCIIRSTFLEKIKQAYDKNKDLDNLLLDEFFKAEIIKAEKSLRECVVLGVNYEIPVACFSSALSFFDAYKLKASPVNLLQALRDFFGSHGYEMVGKPRGEMFHTVW